MKTAAEHMMLASHAHPRADTYAIAIAAIEAAVADERARWREWCIKFSEQPIPEALMVKAEEKSVSIRDAISLGWSSVLLALQAELIREKREENQEYRRAG